MFDIPRILNETFVAQTDNHAELPSTNDRALHLARDARQPRPLLVLTSRQTHGRGRGVHRWWSADGGLTFSLLLDLATVTPSARRLPQVALLTGVAVCQAIHERLPERDVRLKWPNDVYLDGRKVGGILVELPAQPRGRVVVGVGINVNNRLTGAPDDVRSRAASLVEVAGAELDLNDVLIRVLRRFAELTEAFVGRRLRLSEVCSPWGLLTGRYVCVTTGRRHVRGQCHGIDDDGALVIGPNRQRCFSGVVEEVTDAA